MMNGLRAILRLTLAVLALAFAQTASAQTVFTYVNGVDGNIDDATTCSAPLVRNFTVTDSFTVSDIDIGVYADHKSRGDLRITLQAPDATRVQLVNGDVNNISGKNFNVRLNDDGTQTVNTDSANGNHSTSNPPPFANNFSPNSPLAAFAGKNSSGTWRLEICDLFPSKDDGKFKHAELYLTSAPPNNADLSLTKTVSNSAPTNGSAITYTLTLRNAAISPLTANNVVVTDLLPQGVVYTTHSGNGSYNPATGQWSIPSVTPGQVRTLTIQASVNATAGATIANIAEVTASSAFDIDSTPNNGVTTEDDYATVGFTVAGTRTAGIPPALSCPKGSSVFDWDTKTWAAGSLTNTFNQPGVGNVVFALSSVVYQPRGSNTPFLDDAGFTGGLNPAQKALVYAVDFVTQTQVQTTQITFASSIAGAQFTLFDIDFQSNAYSDKITVTGQYQGSTVIPVLTNGRNNYVIGNTAIGDIITANDLADANVVVTFNSPVDSITITYGNDPNSSPSDPTGQTIGLHDIRYCNPFASITATKVSAIFTDPVNGSTNPKAIPGALVNYQISVSNAGPSKADANSVIVADKIPVKTKFCLANYAPANGPILFSDGTPSSGLTYSYVSLSSSSDSLEFSSNGGSTWTYTPTADAENCDANITNFRVRPSGAFNTGRTFVLYAQFKLK